MIESACHWAVYEYGFVEPDWLAIICAGTAEEAIAKAEAYYGDMAIISPFTTGLLTIKWLPQECQTLLNEGKDVYSWPVSPESYALWIRDIKARADNATKGPWCVASGSSTHLCTGVFTENEDSLWIADCLSDDMLDASESGRASLPEDHVSNMEFIAHTRKDVSDLLDVSCQMAKALNMAWAVLSSAVGVDIPGRKLQQDMKKALRVAAEAQYAWEHGVTD